MMRRSVAESSHPHSFFIERERNEAGDVISAATILLRNRRCPWRCVYCDLWKQALDFTVPLGAIPAQIDFALGEIARSGGDQTPRQIKLYNAGSFFDRAAIPPPDFPAIAKRVRAFERVIVECHPALVGESALTFCELLGHQSDGTVAQLEVAMGLEIADDAILKRLNKRMTRAMFERAARFLRGNGISVRAFVMVKPPFVKSDELAIESAARSAEFAFDCGATVVSLIPSRFGTEELSALAARGEFSPPRLSIIEAALDHAVALRRGRVFVDLWNLELFSSCEHCFSARRDRMDQINHEQRTAPPIACACPGVRIPNDPQPA